MTTTTCVPDPTVIGYGGEPGRIICTTSTSTGSLPFTGLDLVLLVAAAIALILVGGLLRQRRHRPKRGAS